MFVWRRIYWGDLYAVAHSRTFFFFFEESANTRGSGDVADIDPEQQQGTLRALDRLDRLNDRSASCRAERQHIFCKKAVEKQRVISTGRESSLVGSMIIKTSRRS
jgi:hypothetical protein